MTVRAPKPTSAGALADYDGRRVAKMWYDEIKDYRFGSGGFAMNTGLIHLFKFDRVMRIYFV